MNLHGVDFRSSSAMPLTGPVIFLSVPPLFLVVVLRRQFLIFPFVEHRPPDLLEPEDFFTLL